MKTANKFILKLIMVAGLLVTSCTSDNELSSKEENLMKEASGKFSKESLLQQSDNPNRISWEKPKLMIEDFGVKESLLNIVEPSECGPTPFRGVLAYYDDLLFNNFLSVFDGNLDAYFMIFGDYFAINQIAALYLNYNGDSFGANGEYTAYVNNRVRSLEKFWDMEDMVQVNGQHTSTLEDLDLLRYVYENFSTASPEIIDYLMTVAEQYNNAADQIPENPFFASDGFATFIGGTGYIVIGDGLVSMLAEVGLDPKVVWSSILAHEWAHQIQFANFGIFSYPVPPFIDTPESTRMTELEADFMTGYYLTHKRGGTYNWKRVEDFLRAFFEIGDCYFTSNGHHGTPNQRLEAALQGYYLARSQMKNGHIYSAMDVHNVFVNKLDMIVGNE